MNKIVNKLKLIRLEKGYTQRELAKISGISEPTIVTAEKNIYRTRLMTLQKLANILEVSLKDLFCEENEVTKEELEAYESNKCVSVAPRV